MKIKKCKISSIKPNPKNVRVHSESQIDELVKSYKAFGQIRPIVVDEQNVVLAGHGFLEALKKVGENEASIYVAEGLSEAEKKKLMVADNKTYELGSFDFDALTDLFKEISLESDLDIPGYDMEVLENLLMDTDGIDEEISSYGAISEETISNIKESEPQEQKEKEIELDNSKIKIEQTTSQERPRAYATCEKCGEKVWL